MKTGVYSAKKLSTLYTHNPSLRHTSVQRLRSTPTVYSSKTTIDNAYSHKSIPILNTEPILVKPVKDGEVVIDGRHRSTLATYRDVGLRVYVIENKNDVQHRVPRRLIGTTPEELDAFTTYYDSLDNLVRKIKQTSIKQIKDHHGELRGILNKA
jgi:hypothetical protein